MRNAAQEPWNVATMCPHIQPGCIIAEKENASAGADGCSYLSRRLFHPADQSFSIRRSAEPGLALSVMKQNMTQDGAAAVAELGQRIATMQRRICAEILGEILPTASLDGNCASAGLLLA